MALEFKPGVNPAGLKPELHIALGIIDGVYGYYGYRRTTITSLRDSRHSRTSLHWSGQAADVRTRSLDRENLDEIIEEIKIRLGNSPHYDLILEGRGTPNEHLHVEYQPKSA